MAGEEGLNLSALRTKQGLKVSVGGVAYRVGVPKKGLGYGQVYINGRDSSAYSRGNPAMRQLEDGSHRWMLNGVDHLVVQANGDVHLGGDRGLRACIDGTVKLGGGEDDHEGRVSIDSNDDILVGGGDGLVTIRAGRWSLRRAVRRALKPFGAGLVVGAVCYALGSSKLAGSGSKAQAAKAPPPLPIQVRWSWF